jgi:hypothetical protein
MDFVVLLMLLNSIQLLENYLFGEILMKNEHVWLVEEIKLKNFSYSFFFSYLGY